jgi:DNA-binding NarL/FixJ family response regulator
MTSRARRIPDSLLECYLADALDAEERGRLEALLASSPEDRARLEELRKDSLEFYRQHHPEPLIASFQEAWERTFSDQDRARLRRVAPIMASMVRNWRLLGEMSERDRILDALFHHQGVEGIVLALPSTEVLRTAHATALLEKWFAPIEMDPQGLPRVLLEWLVQLEDSRGAGVRGQDVWERPGPNRSLRVTLVPLPEGHGGRRLWGLMLQEVVQAQSPGMWRTQLTERELAVVEDALQGWDIASIAEHLNCSKLTVKKHLQRIFAKVGVASRAELMARASSLGRSDNMQAGTPEDEMFKDTPGGELMLSALRKTLTPRQKEILDAVNQGLDEQLISARLGLSVRAVKAHLQALSILMGVEGVAELKELAGSLPQESPERETQ